MVPGAWHVDLADLLHSFRLPFSLESQTRGRTSDQSLVCFIPSLKPSFSTPILMIPFSARVTSASCLCAIFCLTHLWFASPVRFYFAFVFSWSTYMIIILPSLEAGCNFLCICQPGLRFKSIASTIIFDLVSEFYTSLSF